MSAEITRRGAMVLTAAGLMAAAPAAARPPLTFEVWRGRSRIGRHTVSFSGAAGDFSVSIEAVMSVGLGPITLFRYHHQALETWRGGAFTELVSHTLTNGRREQLSALRTPAGVAVNTLAGAHLLPAASLPLTHWNPHTLTAPLFNPETGEAMRESVIRQAGQSARLANGRAIPATRYTLSGDAELSDWYDLAGAWAALRAKASDGSVIDYRRVGRA
ncbi:MAG TPA: DUF6134 family protein [Caulobacteraceae bacterium]|jgi:hypothetical protein|nr:DUF6134 family protein [Caulobacteraceae bacterium]